jgi:hypothetical protein
MNPMVRSGWQDSAKSFVATPTRSPPKVPFNKRLSRLNGEETFRYAGGPVRPRVAKR